MNSKERFLATLRGKKADRVPFAPSIGQWYYVNKDNGTLPEEVRGQPDPTEVLRFLGADLLSKSESPMPVPTYNGCEYTVEFSGGLDHRPIWTGLITSFSPAWGGNLFAGGRIRHERIRTPDGTLTHIFEYSAEAGAPFETEHWWKDFESEFPAVRNLLQHSEWHLDAKTLRLGLDKVGDDGVVLFQLLPSTLKQFHWLAGQINTSYFLMDHPGEMRELADIYEKSWLAYVEEVADLPDVWVYEVPDNVDSLFYTPEWFREFCVTPIRKAAEILHARGKFLFVHSCGRLKCLGPLFIEAGLDSVNGQAPPPIGDWPLHEARMLSDKLVVSGGMAAPEQELKGPDAAKRIDAYVRGLFASMGNRRRFIFNSSCSTSPRTPYSNLVAFRDAAWKYGIL